MQDGGLTGNISLSDSVQRADNIDPIPNPKRQLYKQTEGFLQNWSYPHRQQLRLCLCRSCCSCISQQEMAVWRFDLTAGNTQQHGEHGEPAFASHILFKKIILLLQAYTSVTP